MSPLPNYHYPGYVFPFLHSKPGRTDQGKDFTGSDSILAIGKAEILATKPPPGWPEGGGVLYKLLEGPKAGTSIYVYEGVDVLPGVRPRMTVEAGTPIASFRKGGSIEIGFADSHGETIAHDRGESAPGNSNLRAGREFQRFLGQLQHAGPHGGFQDSLSPGERQKAEAQAKKEGGKLGGNPFPSSSELLSGIFGEIHPEALMLNIGLIGGGAFLVYYGAALMLGAKSPVKSLAEAGAVAAVPK
ncbi:MAG TPA: hypothetical protein VNY83_07470 [Solirubrobacterales bacterium]|jgi:hypothetical protein|nr:hypothetical protein [Solirubrobacterales bacterium]